MTVWEWAKRGGNWRGTCDRGFVMLDVHVIFDDSHATVTATAFFSDGSPSSTTELRYRKAEHTLAEIKTHGENAGAGLARARWISQAKTAQLARIGSPENFATRLTLAREGPRVTRRQALQALPALVRSERALLADKSLWTAIRRAVRLVLAQRSRPTVVGVDSPVRNRDARRP